MASAEKQDWARFGAELKKARELAGITQAQLANTTGWARSTISALQTGNRTPQRAQVEALDEVLATDGALMRLWATITNHAADVPPSFRDVLAVERKATAIREYQSILIPGLLQVPEYAEVLIRARLTTATDEQVTRLVRVRVARLPEITKSARPLLWFVVKESAITQMVGDEKIMREQLGHLAGLADAGTIQLQVLPDTRVVPGLCAPFRVHALNETQAVAYVEHALDGELVELPKQVDELMTVFGRLQAEALPPSASIDLVRRRQGEL